MKKFLSVVCALVMVLGLMSVTAYAAELTDGVFEGTGKSFGGDLKVAVTVEGGKITKKRKGYTVQRYKGLGEMDPKQLASTTMDPKTRILQRVTIEDAITADRAVRELMGSEVSYRREYIEKHAHDARFLDA